MINKQQINNEICLKEEKEFQSNEINHENISSGKRLENLSEDFEDEGLDRNELYNNPATVRIKKENIMTDSINFDSVKEDTLKKQAIDLESNLNHDKKTEIEYNGNLFNRKSDNIKKEIQIIEEHFINTNRDFKPILYDEDFNNIIVEEKMKQTNAKHNHINRYDNPVKNVDEMKDKINNNFFRDNVFENNIEEIKENTNEDNDIINCKNSNKNNESNESEIEFTKKGDDYTNTLNVDDHLKDTNLVGNYRNEPFANTDDIMIVSFIEDKLKSDKNGIFYGLNKIYFFVNKRSGSQEGKIILDISQKHNKNFEVKENDKNVFNELYQNINVVKVIRKKNSNNTKETEDIYVFVIDLLDNEKITSGIESLKINCSQDESVKVLIGGGDGTVLQVVEDLHKKNIHIGKCIFGHVPLGTGNDLSNSMGFGSKVNVPTEFTKFENLISKYFNATETSIDVWKMRLNLEGISGDMIKVDFANRKSSLRNLNEELKNSNVFKKTFINYLSLGYDARVGYGFDKKRSSSRCWNKCIYFWEGLKKNCCTKTAGINSIIDKFEELDEEDYYNKRKISENNLINNNNNEDLEDISSNGNSIITAKENIMKRNVIFLGKSQEGINKEQIAKNRAFLKGNPVNLICQNINFYMGGTKDIWKKSLTKIALEKDTESYINRVKTWNQSSNDKKLEFFSYSSGIDLGLEKIKSGNANKVYQGKGPFVITFKDMSRIAENDKVNRIYLNVDGEYYKLLRPIEMRIRLNKKLNNGSLRFLCN